MGVGVGVGIGVGLGNGVGVGIGVGEGGCDSIAPTTNGTETATPTKKIAGKRRANFITHLLPFPVSLPMPPRLRKQESGSFTARSRPPESVVRRLPLAARTVDRPQRGARGDSRPDRSPQRRAPHRTRAPGP